MELVFAEAREAAKHGPAVLFFDEADGFFAKGEYGSIPIEGLIKDAWSQLLTDFVPCYVIGATNNPWTINMGDWGRRFAHRLHVGLPDEAARTSIFTKILSKERHDIDEDGMFTMSKETEGYCISDIKSVVRKVAVRKGAAVVRARGWVTDVVSGAFIPAAESEEPEVADISYKELQTKNLPVEAAPIKLEEVLAGIKKHQPANPPGADDKYKEWKAGLRKMA
jgi:vacuolar protein-sorting-associated protein 4